MSRQIGVRAMAGSRNVAIGERAGHMLTRGDDNFLVGREAGADLTDESGVTIIGDGIRSLDPADNAGVLYIGVNVAIGDTLFGELCNLKTLLEDQLWRYGAVSRVEP